MSNPALPKVGNRLRDASNNGTALFTVTDIHPGSGGYPGMILEWADGEGRRRGQVFTTRDWKDRWVVVT